MDHNEQRQHDPARRPGRATWALIGFLLVGGFFLLTEHRAHVLGALPYLLLLACPLMHLFHHGHHHGHRSNGQAPGADHAPQAHEEEKS